ncbi:hypothetical protein ACIQWR_12845 [Streptomyces sp. NPDC098789]|uniref:hypothetical protein n=1 Tax=Streptomyces sp. NPDC098789 TaxID=3366098 RepID=UPI0037F974F3
MAHKPLSNWVIAVHRDGDGDGYDRVPGALVNGGDERADARHLAEFATGWRRAALPLPGGGTALGLVRSDHLGADDRTEHTEAVVELSGTAVPVPVSAPGARVLASIEDHWPPRAFDPPTTAALAGEHEDLRHLLLARLVAESAAGAEPVSEVFHILPWHRVDALARAVTSLIESAASGPEVRLGYVFAPAGSRFTAALEQLDHGLRAADRAAARTGAGALCARLLLLDPDRLPAATRDRLRELLAVLHRFDPFLRASAQRADAHLAAAADRWTPAELSSVFELTAGATQEVRRVRAALDREPFALKIQVTSTGTVEIDVEAVLPADEIERATEPYGTLLLPLRVTGLRSGSRLLVVLYPQYRRLLGRVTAPLDPDVRVRVDQDGPPLGSADLPLVDPADVRASVRAAELRSARDAWAALANGLPVGHPVRTAAEEGAR